MRAESTISSVPLTFTARRYGDPFMVAKMGLDTNYLGTGNFQNIDDGTLQDDANMRIGFGAVSNFQVMDDAAITFLKSIQPADGITIKQKMNWLGVVDNPTPDMPNTYGRPYMVKKGRNTWGTMVFGGQKVQVETQNGVPVLYEKYAKYQSEGGSEVRLLPFFKLIGLRKSDFTRPLVELLREGLVQKCTEAYMYTNEYNEHPQGGTIYNPVWSPLDYPTNLGKTELFIARAFLEGF